MTNAEMLDAIQSYKWTICFIVEETFIINKGTSRKIKCRVTGDFGIVEHSVLRAALHLAFAAQLKLEQNG